MRTDDPNVNLQYLIEEFTGAKVQIPQHQGVYLATVVDTHTNNPQLPEGVLAFSIPHINVVAGWIPAPFPGVVDPPIGTECVVAFEGVFSNAPRVIAFTDWQAPVISYTADDPSDTRTPTVGDLWIIP